MATAPFRRSSVWVTCLVLALLSSCGGSPTTTALDPAVNNSGLDSGDEEGTVTLNLAEALSTRDPVGRMAAAVIVVTPAGLDGNNDFFVSVGQFAPETTVFNVSDLLVAGVLEADYLAQGSLIISYNRNQNQTIITLRNRTTGFRVRIRIRGGDFRGQIGLATFIFDQPTLIPGFGSDPIVGSTIDLGSATINTDTGSKTLTISNTGTAKLEVGAALLTGTNPGDFTVSPSMAFDIDVSGSQDVTITCTPSDLGTRTATLELTTNDANIPTVSYDLKCEGLAVPVPIFGSDPIVGSTIDLGSATINTDTGSKTLTISNTGTAKLEVGAAQLTGTNPGDFTVSPSMAFDIDVSGSQDVTITCTPSDLGTRTAT
ncbi:MAG: choice-of-anchor D domain-containing protein, partial [Synechococcaceae cyanobacterium SM2_3_2]|nr:choice-of-anchor D domain-containing protein [Synechococcaceae cyanobacterium SM2_3_2]